AHLEIGESEGGIDEDLHDFLGRFVGDLFDFDAAFGRGDDDRTRGGAVEKDGEVVFFFDVARDGEVDGLDLATGGAGLRGDERVVEHLAGDVLGFGFRLVELHAAFVAIGERALTATAGVNLRLHHRRAFGQPAEGGVKFG